MVGCKCLWRSVLQRVFAKYLYPSQLNLPVSPGSKSFQFNDLRYARSNKMILDESINFFRVDPQKLTPASKVDFSIENQALREGRFAGKGHQKYL